MRTTITLRDDLHRRLSSAAQDRHTSLNQVVNDLLERALTGASGPKLVGTDPLTGFPIVEVGHPVTTEDVRSLEDDE